MKKKYMWAIAILLLCAQSVSAQVTDKLGIEDKIDALIPATVNDTTPGIVIGVVQDGEVVFAKGYGLANLAYGLPNDDKKVYNIGSVTKQFLGYAFAMISSATFQLMPENIRNQVPVLR